MITAIIVEDERYSLDYITEMVEKTGFFKVTGAYQKPMEALKDSIIQSIQVAFLDIDMPVVDGFSLAEILQTNNPAIQIVFITAFSQYAVQAFEINAVDYILKPINEDRFFKMAEKIKMNVEKIHKKSQSLRIKCFGSFEVSLDNKPVRWERAKAEELFAFLLANHNRKIHKEIILEELWPGYEPAKALAILQTSIYKLRNIFSSLEGLVEIKYEDSKYYLSISEVECELFDFEKLLSVDYKEESFCNNMEKACDMIEEGFMQQSGYLWCYTKNLELVTRLKRILMKASEFYSKENKETLAQRIKALHERVACN